MKKKDIIIVSADDFGTDSEADRKILMLVKAGKINRLAVFVNKENLPVSVLDDARMSGVMIDIHLELPNGNGKDGASNVRRLWHFFANYLTGKNSLSQVDNYWSRQVEKFHSLFGRYPDGLNSHEHVHLFPFYFPIACKLCDKYNIPFIRIGTKQFFTMNPVSIILSLMKVLSIQKLKRLKTNTSDFMISLNWIKSFEKIENLNKKNAKIEIVTHPGLSKEYDFIMEYL